CKQGRPHSAELSLAAARIGEIFRAQWQRWINGSDAERAALATQCASANIRAALMNVFITCAKLLYEERRGTPFIANAERARAEKDSAWLKKRNDLVTRAYQDHRDALTRSIRGSHGRSTRDSRAEDVVHEVFVRLLHVADVYGIESIKNYLSIITRRVM